jgi:hypothetical protein
MKKALLASLILLALTAAALAPANPLVGRWQKKFPNGDVLLASFRPDGTYDLFVNSKAFVSGQYTLKQDDFAVSDGHCNLTYFGTYKVRFYSGSDSLRFTLVQDSCRSRRQGTSGLVLGRVKTTKL